MVRGKYSEEKLRNLLFASQSVADSLSSCLTVPNSQSSSVVAQVFDLLLLSFHLHETALTCFIGKSNETCEGIRKTKGIKVCMNTYHLPQLHKATIEMMLSRCVRSASLLRSKMRCTAPSSTTSSSRRGTGLLLGHPGEKVTMLVSFRPFGGF